MKHGLIWVLTCLAASACSVSTSTGSGASEPVVASDGPPVAERLQAADVEGYWSGDWGKLMLREVPGGFRATYVHDSGTVTGVVGEDGVFRGWWCEVPSRQGPRDAGPAEFRFVRQDGQLALDGRWRYANEESWRENWDLTRIEDQPPQALVDRFNDDSAFCSHP